MLWINVKCKFCNSVPTKSIEGDDARTHNLDSPKGNGSKTVVDKLVMLHCHQGNTTSLRPNLHGWMAQWLRETDRSLLLHWPRVRHGRLTRTSWTGFTIPAQSCHTQGIKMVISVLKWFLLWWGFCCVRDRTVQLADDVSMSRKCHVSPRFSFCRKDIKYTYFWSLKKYFDQLLIT